MKVEMTQAVCWTNPQYESIQHKLSDIILETFVEPADVDYVTARFMALNHQHRPFFWPALQAIEKYLKANLLFQGIPVKGKRFGHKISEMSARLLAADSRFRIPVLKPHEKHQKLEQLNLWGSSNWMDFIAAIERYGAASNRYNYFGADYEASYLPKLDQVVFALRSRLVAHRPLKGVEGIGNRTAFRHAAYEHNLCFAPADYVHDELYGTFGLGLSTPSIEIALKGLYGSPHLFRDWVRTNIKIRDDEIARLQE